jgi:hypothetical protein
MPDTQKPPPRVFISYAHESPKHEERVLELADKLREYGIDAIIDQYEPTPQEGWPRWMVRQLEDADYVLMICTPAYHRRIEHKDLSFAPTNGNMPRF